MKRLGALLILLVSLLVLPACSKNEEPTTNNDSNNSNNNNNSSSVKNNPTLEYKFTDNDKRILDNKMTLAEQALNDNDFVKFYSLYDMVMDYWYDIDTYGQIEYIKFSMDGNEDSLDKYYEFIDISEEVMIWNNEIYKKVYDSSFKDLFFAGYTEEEILEMISVEYTEDYEKYNDEANAILEEYYTLSSTELTNRAPELYEDLVSAYNNMSRELGYSNYLDYAYKKIYQRDYTVEDSISFTQYVSEYIIPEYMALYAQYYIDLSSLSKEEDDLTLDFSYGSYKNYMSMFDSYAEYIGGSYYTAYNELWNGGYYFFPKSSNASSGAYTTYLYSLDTPALYCSEDYQQIFTLVHEYGHYYSYMCQNGGYGSYDLCETQSQANEMLFLNYVENNSTFSDKVLKVIKEEKILYAYDTIIISALVNEFERRVYTAQTPYSAEDYDALFLEILDEMDGSYDLSQMYGDNITDYWKMVAIEQAGYYISYATSLIPSLNIYQLALDDFDEAIDAYLSICNYSYYNSEFVSLITSVGLENPFTEEAFEAITSIF